MTMEIEDVGKVLGVAAAFDNRIVGKADTLAWYQVIGHLDCDEAQAAVCAHYADTNERIMPADVLRLVKAARTARLASMPEALPDADPNDERSYRRAIREGRYRTASGFERPRPVRELMAGAFRNVAPVPVEIADRDGREAREALAVACPYCDAAPGKRCVNPLRGRKIRRTPHPSRVREFRGDEASAS